MINLADQRHERQSGDSDGALARTLAAGYLSATAITIVRSSTRPAVVSTWHVSR